jgi:hypothetical protein
MIERGDSGASVSGNARTPGRALVLHASAETPHGRGASSSRPATPFVAQLIATARQVAQTRPRRRAGPAEAAAAYGGIMLAEAAPRAALRSV